jgi:peptidoglycan/xylan/chitin deacetylase (PgdA/CDA1 family)
LKKNDLSSKTRIIMALLGCMAFLFTFFGCRHGYTALPVDQKIIALTFDDGPNPLYTPKVLEILEEHDIKATFFVIGRKAQASPEIVRNIKAAGHEIENHSWSHLFWLSSLTPQKIEKEICATQDIIFNITGEYPAFFRAPFGWTSDQLFISCQKLSLPVMDGSIKPGDTAMPGKDNIVSSILRRADPGAIIILHDGGGFWFYKNRSQTLEALPEVIQGLKDRGYTFVTIKELFDYHIKSARSPIIHKATFY